MKRIAVSILLGLSVLGCPTQLGSVVGVWEGTSRFVDSGMEGTLTVTFYSDRTCDWLANFGKGTQVSRVLSYRMEDNEVFIYGDAVGVDSRTGFIYAYDRETLLTPDSSDAMSGATQRFENIDGEVFELEALMETLHRQQ